MSKSVLALAMILLSGLASATDLGVQGQIFPIQERDLRERLIESAAKVDWQKTQQGLKTDAENYTKNLTPFDLPRPAKSFVRWTDPSVEVAEDIKTPIFNETTKEYEMTVVYKKGTRVNPLTKYRPVSTLFFFDGRDPEQVEVAQRLVDRDSLRIVPIATGGDVGKLTKSFKRPVFFAHKIMLDKAEVTHSPALVFPGENDRALNIGTAFFAKGTTANTIYNTWQFYTSKKTVPQKGKAK